MTITVTIDEAQTRLAELVARAEAGEEVVIARGDAPIARLSAVPRRRDVGDAIAAVRAARAGLPPTTAEEILAWRDEGRRFK